MYEHDNRKEYGIFLRNHLIASQEQPERVCSMCAAEEKNNFKAL